jgi:hypothetical protein
MRLVKLKMKINKNSNDIAKILVLDDKLKKKKIILENVNHIL